MRQRQCLSRHLHRSNGLTLSAYTYTIQYKAGNYHANADGLSRLPLEDGSTAVLEPAETIHLMGHLAASPVSATHIRQQTHHDPTLSKVRSFIQHGWLDELPNTNDMQLYHRWRHDLSIEDRLPVKGKQGGCASQIAQQSGRRTTHKGHPGIAKM